MSDYKIDIIEARQLVLNFITRPELSAYAYQKSIGAILNVASVTVPTEGVGAPEGSQFGLIAWYCWKANPPMLAFEEGEYDINNVPTEPNSLQLKASDNIIIYNKDPNLPDVESYMKEPINLAAILPDRSITKNEVMEVLNGIPLDDQGKKFNIYPLGFFESRVCRDVADFINQTDIQYVKYFYGFDDSQPGYVNSNRIRIILQAFNGDGEWIAPSPDNPHDGMLLQKSVPPPYN